MKKVLCSLCLLSTTGLCLIGGLTQKQSLSLKAEPVLYDLRIEVSQLTVGTNTLYTTNGNPIKLEYVASGGSLDNRIIYTKTRFQFLKTISWVGPAAASNANGQNMSAHVNISDSSMVSNTSNTGNSSSPYSVRNNYSLSGRYPGYFAISWDKINGTMNSITIRYSCE